LILDHFGGLFAKDMDVLEAELRAAAQSAGATVIDAKFHRFGERGGVTGVVLLAESHISIHTWPELNYAAIDIFMCGAADAHIAARHLEQALRPDRVKLTEVSRSPQRNQ
jgi:S-adenosylmethionine decarboxylase